MGITIDDMWMHMQEYLIRIGSRKEGRVVEAAEILRRVGPFPNQSNSLKGTYVVNGTNGLQINFNKIATDEEKKVDVDVIYSSQAMIAIQTLDEGGECDFFVLTPIKDLQRRLNKELGLERRRFFFN